MNLGVEQPRLAHHRAATQPRPSRIELVRTRLPTSSCSLRGVDISVDRVASMEDVPDRVADYLAREHLPANIRMAPIIACRTYPGTAADVNGQRGKTDGTKESLTGAFADVAETGTLIMRSGLNTPPLSIPPRHPCRGGRGDRRYLRRRRDQVVMRTVNLLPDHRAAISSRRSLWCTWAATNAHLDGRG